MNTNSFTCTAWLLILLQRSHISDSNQGSDYIAIFTARKRSLGQGNKFTGVCLSTGGVPDQVQPPGPCTPPNQVPPGPGTPPGTRYPLGPGTPVINLKK